MSLTSSIFLIITVFLIYYVLIHIYTLFLRVTGLTKEKARFQSISLLTNAGFTTSESEIITLERRRRAIAKSAMLIGYFFSVVFVSLVINLFLSIDFTKMDELIPLFSLSFGGLILFLILLNLPPVRKHQERLIEKITLCARYISIRFLSFWTVRESVTPSLRTYIASIYLCMSERGR